MTEFPLRFQLYARSHGREAQAQLCADGHDHGPFFDWIGARWDEWATGLDHGPSVSSDDDHAAFDAWLTDRAVECVTGRGSSAPPPGHAPGGPVAPSARACSDDARAALPPR